ncbi:MAG: type I DNA topoisomerase [Planctomycetaceae bacterium]|nr:type I DNA topoisomerase [Planctomycetaceae bacterium]
MVSKTKKALVIVESPAKAKKISGYLGPDYIVKASMGHVRDLPAKAEEVPKAIKEKNKELARLCVDVDHDFSPVYVVPSGKKKLIKELKSDLAQAQELLIATDEDREGESIGWHLIQLLEPKVPVKRMVFSEITKEAILEALENPRKLDEDLVEAQETRRVVDRLFGYTLSPLLWKKVKPSLSAGRVQSVAVRLLVQREWERIAFHSATYWDLKALLKTEDAKEFEATLSTVDGKKVASGKDFDENTGKLKEGADVVLLSEAQATELVSKLKTANWQVTDVEDRNQVRRPYPPFTTSTLQQEANRKLNMSARDTMRVAQRLYEDGQITYMRTDSVNLSKEAITAARKCVKDRYGDEYLYSEVRQFTTKSKNAQEAHEAIRPAGNKMQTAQELGLTGQEARLYELIWKRTVATQMEEAKLLFQTVTISAENTEFRASGRHVVFPGFFRAYVEGVDDPEAALDDQESALPPLKSEDRLQCQSPEAVGHETKPPARYTEATLVRKLESEAIGRPSTYASIIGTIQNREYALKSGNQLIPTYLGMAVTNLLEGYFPNLVDYGFTARMEQSLDDIATGDAERLPYLESFFLGDEGLNNQVKVKEETIDPRAACTLKFTNIGTDIRVGRYGTFVQEEHNGDTVSASISEQIPPSDLTREVIDRELQLKLQGPTPIGHNEDGLPVYVKTGPFGPYVQLGDVDEEAETKPKRVGIPKNINPIDVDLELALKLLELPKRLGRHPETNKVVNAGIGRFGPYVTHDKIFKSFGKDGTAEVDGEKYNVLNVTLEAAIEMLKTAKRKAAPEPIRTLGNYPEEDKPVAIFDGRYGPYIKYGRINVTVPKEKDVESITLEEAVALIDQKAEQKGVKKKATPKATKKKAAKKKAAKKKATKKKAAKKKKS